MKIRDVMSKHVLSISKEGNFTEACRLMQQMGIHHLPVVEDNKKLVGMFSANDALKAFNNLFVSFSSRSEEEINDQLQIDQCMSQQKLYYLDSDAELKHALTVMKEFEVHAVPVVEQGELVGIVTATDILYHCTLD